MKKLAAFLLFSIWAALPVAAQPEVDAILHSASYVLPGLPNDGIPQGGIFTAFGRNLGPVGLQQVSAFPLETTMDGISIEVTVGTTSVNAIPISRAGVPEGQPATQVSAILPSSAPVGEGTLRLTYNGQTSGAVPIKVVAHNFGIYTLNSAGSGPAVMTDWVHYDVNLLTQSAQPGQEMILWGSGLGPVAGNEAAGPLPGDLGIDVQVYVGGKPAMVTYRGRSGCCAGLDQFHFVVPEGVEGCYVPVVVVVEGVPSNFTTISVSPAGGACAEPGVFSAQDLTDAAERGFLRLGTVSLARFGLQIPTPLGPLDINLDTGFAEFARYDFNNLIRYQGALGLFAPGSCLVYTFEGSDPDILDPIEPEHLEAGPALHLTGPRGMKELPRTDRGQYDAELGGGGPFVADYLDPGLYQLNNGAGGEDVGPFQAMLTIPQQLVWQNRGQVNNIPRSQGLTITWTGGDPSGRVAIAGFSAVLQEDDEDAEGGVGALFFCTERSDAGQFTIPSYVLSSLPPSVIDPDTGEPNGVLLVGSTTQPARFSAAGLDIGLWYSLTLSGKNVAYE